jgi:hypothetical protein
MPGVRATYARKAVVSAFLDETRRPWWRRERATEELHDAAVPGDAFGDIDGRIETITQIFQTGRRKTADTTPGFPRLPGTQGPGKVGDPRSRSECSHCRYCWSIADERATGGL